MRARSFSLPFLIWLILSLASSANGSDSLKRPYVNMNVSPPPTRDILDCSRQQSRVAAKVLSEYLHPHVASKNFNLSTTCALRLDNDMFLSQEKSKKENHPNSFTCGLCSKMFRKEKFIDMHLHNRHLHEIPEGAPCLANLCPLIHCNHFEEMEERGMVHKKGKVRPKCKDAEMDLRRHKCEALAEQCFPRKESRVAAELNAFFKHQFCDAHSCKGGGTPFPLGSVRKRVNVIYYVVVVVMFFILALGYGTFYYQERNIRRSPRDLRRLKQPDGAIWQKILALGGKKKKQY